MPCLWVLVIIFLAGRVCSELQSAYRPHSSAVERIHGKDQTSFRLRVRAPIETSLGVPRGFLYIGLPFCYTSSMENKDIIGIRMLSSATSVPGQGVGSAYMEQVSLIKEQTDLFKVYEGKEKGRAQINHVHTVNPSYRMKMDSHHVNVIYVHFLPTTLNGSIKLPPLSFKIFKSYVKGTYKKADEIVVVNPIFIKPLVEMGIDEENITFIPNYVSSDEFHPLSQEEILKGKEKYGIDPNKFSVLGCGQVQTRKGVLDFLETAKSLPEVEFLWAGGFSFGKMTDGYKELKKAMDEAPKNVHFLGLLPREDMNLVFNMASIFFMPSFDELMPMSILEACDCQKPLLLRDLDLYPGIFFDRYASAHDVTGFVTEIKRFASDPDYYACYVEESAKIAEFYSKEHVASLWREYYPRILRKWEGKKKIRR